MGKETILAFDIGTSSIKASLFGSDGAMLYSMVHAYPTRYGEGGQADQDPEDWWRGLCALAASLREQAPERWQQVAVLGVGGHMLSCVPVDGKGQALSPALIHADARAHRQCREIGEKIGEKRLYEMSGNRLDPRSTLCKVQWFKDCEPGIYRRTARFLCCKDVVVARLTGNIDTTDFSDASHGEMMDISTGRYDDAVFAELGLDRKKLPTLHRGTEVVGRVTRAAAEQLSLREGIPVIAGAGDGPSATLGVGAVHPGDAYLCLGTTAWIGVLADKPCFDPQQRIFSISMADGEKVSVIGTVQAACSALNWAMRLVGLEDPAQADVQAQKAPPGSGGMVFLPYLEGERSPIFDNQARGVYFGLRGTQEQSHLLRATLEGVAFALRSVLDAMGDHFFISRMRIIGGGAKSALWREILASAFGIPLDIVNISAGDVTSAGIAMAAGLAVGLFATPEKAAGRVRVAGTVEPNPAWQQAYQETYKIYCQLYPALKTLMHQQQE